MKKVLLPLCAALALAGCATDGVYGAGDLGYRAGYGYDYDTYGDGPYYPGYGFFGFHSHGFRHGGRGFHPHAGGAHGGFHGGWR